MLHIKLEGVKNTMYSNMKQKNNGFGPLQWSYWVGQGVKNHFFRSTEVMLHIN